MLQLLKGGGGGEGQQRWKRLIQYQCQVKYSKEVKSLGLTAFKHADFSQWYIQCLTRSEMLDYSDISGCYILRPWGYSIWSRIKSFLQEEFTKRGILEAYFPLFISELALKKEKEHIEGFSPEVAWVTHAGEDELSVKLAIRPTSETAIYPAYSNWIRTRRDLPLRLNQWCNVVRWEFKNPQPFIRSREFLWQEGHSVFSSREEANLEVKDILSLYRKTFEELLAVPVIEGVKSINEKFAGADYTTTVEAFIPEVGRAIQGATSHSLGQNFSKIFNIKYEDYDGKMQYAWQNSWGFTTRSIGITVMTHSDDKGLVLPPRVAEEQIVIIPVGITSKSEPKDISIIQNTCKEALKRLEDAGFRAFVDFSNHHTPGWKFSHWELKGIPIRLEIGPKEIDSGTLSASIRYDGSKVSISWDHLTSQVGSLLDSIHNGMFSKAQSKYNSNISHVTTSWKDALEQLGNRKMVLMPWCEEVACETFIKTTSKKTLIDNDEQSIASVKSLCIPFEQPFHQATTTMSCAACGKAANRWALFGKSY